MSKDLKEMYILAEQQLLLIQRYFMSDSSDYISENGMRIVFIHTLRKLYKYLINRNIKY